MPKHLNPPDILTKMAENLLTFVKMEDKEVTKYMCKLFDGILDDATIRRYMKKEWKMKTINYKNVNNIP
jgi:transcription termination factor NusB